MEQPGFRRSHAQASEQAMSATVTASPRQADVGDFFLAGLWAGVICLQP